MAKYLKDSRIVELESRIISIGDDNTIILEDSIFYPNGGGQPCDQGTITVGDGWRMEVVDVFKENGVTVHKGTIVSDDSEDNSPATKPENGTKCLQKVDYRKRYHHSMIHTAGHLMDHAIELLKLPFYPVNGFHHPEGPYVTYDIDIDAVSSDPAISKILADKKGLSCMIENECLSLIEKKIPITPLIYEDIGKCPPALVSLVPAKIREDAEFLRFIEFEGLSLARPCGGTHIHSTGELEGTFHIRKVDKKKNRLRICYQIDQ